ncbi:MAG: SMC-Scp complex subunit ScpB [Proteobacteria bacterium]|nr:SMC-Scp complex subunit ScpB [Pseudomonadota bacterium]
MLQIERIKQIVEAALLCADEPLTIELLERLFAAEECDTATLKSVLDALEHDTADRGIELKRVASGYRFQVRQELAPWMSRMWEDRPPRYSRALLETLALIAYKQPVTRGDIEQVRGVTVNSNMVRMLLERDWIRVVGYREVPGRPAMYGTTKTFLDYFNLKTLDELPTLPEIKALIEPIEAELAGAGPEYLEGPRVEFPGDSPIDGTDAAANDAVEEVAAAHAEPER